MTLISNYLTSDHRLCDESLAQLEELVSRNDWNGATKIMKSFLSEMLRHFNCEENILFPAFENASGMASGPTMVMRMEHIQMKDMLTQLKNSVDLKNQDRVLGICETLMIFIQQHNGKEEQMLYRMCDMHLKPEGDSLISQMKAIKNDE